MNQDKEKLLIILKAVGTPQDVVDAFALIKRELFVPDQVQGYAYEDMALPLDDGSTLSQPSTTAFMLKLLDAKSNHNILEIGSGSGYALALLSKIATEGKIYGMEINTRLAVRSKTLLENEKTVEILNRSGMHGLPEHSPYDRILVSAACPDRRIAYRLVEQLKDPGILVVPIHQTIFKIVLKDNRITEYEYPGFTFVPFLAKE